MLLDFILDNSLDLGYSQTRSKQAEDRGVTAVILGRDKLPFDLICSRKGLHVAGVMCHEMLLALPTFHVDTNNCLWPRDGIAEFLFANRVCCDHSRLSVRTSACQWAINKQIEFARGRIGPKASGLQFTNSG